MDAASAGSLALVGDPGIGKSSLLAELARRLEDGDSTVVLLRAGELAAQSIGNLRVELNLDHELKDVLRACGPERAFLILDALDATRGDAGKAAAMRQLIEAALALRTEVEWHVVASIRRFDLLWSTEWQRLFRAAVRRTGDLGDVSHLDVAILDDKELAQVAVAAPALVALINNAPDALRELLRVPFNLRLAAELELDANTATSIRSQLDLLDRYWSERVERGPGGESRVRAMREVATQAIDRNTTRVERTVVSNPEALEQLEHARVLVRTGDHIEAAHHVVLDYAISRTVLAYLGDRTTASAGRCPCLLGKPP